MNTSITTQNDIETRFDIVSAKLQCKSFEPALAEIGATSTTQLVDEINQIKLALTEGREEREMKWASIFIITVLTGFELIVEMIEKGIPLDHSVEAFDAMKESDIDFTKLSDSCKETIELGRGFILNDDNLSEEDKEHIVKFLDISTTNANILKDIRTISSEELHVRQVEINKTSPYLSFAA